VDLFFIVVLLWPLLHPRLHLFKRVSGASIAGDLHAPWLDCSLALERSYTPTSGPGDMSSIGIAVSTPEVLWHGGGNENGKPDPVYSVDFHPQEMVLLTSGIDANVPPKGSVRVSTAADIT
jgi:hypothetical protein